MLLSNKLVVVDGIELGLTVSMCTAEGDQIGRAQVRPRLPYPDPEVTMVPIGAPYFTVVIPWAPESQRTEWHPTEATGPFKTLTRGAFGTESEAHQWASDHLNNTAYEVRRIAGIGE